MIESTPFRNEQIYPSGLPSAEQLDYQALDRRHLSQIRVGYVIFSVILLIGLLVMLTGSGKLLDLYYFLGSVGAWLLFCLLLLFVYARLVYRRRKYALRQNDISYRSGVLITRLITIPFNRIQHCDISRGLADQFFDLSKLNIYTAGGSASDITIPGLPEDEAARLKAFILKKTSADGQHSSPRHDEEE